MQSPSSLPAAPVWRRLAALLYDSLILAAIAFGFTALATLIAGTRSSDYSPTVGGPWLSLGLLLSLSGFYVYFWRKSGQTVGMRAWRLKLVQTNRVSAPGWLRLWLRALVGALGFAMGGAGYIWCWFDREGDSLPDRLTELRTIVESKPSKS